MKKEKFYVIDNDTKERVSPSVSYLSAIDLAEKWNAESAAIGGSSTQYGIDADEND